MRNYHQQQEKEVLPSYVPGDIIKERVEPKPELGQLWEMLNKRYRTPTENAHQAALRETRLDILEEKAMEKATLKEAYDFMLAELIKFDGHERNIIHTEAELVVIRSNVAKVSIIQTVLNGYAKGHTEFTITGAFNRQLAMRKVNFHRFAVLGEIRQRLIGAGFVLKEMKDVEKQIGSARHPKTVIAKEPSYSVGTEGKDLLTKLEDKNFSKETLATVNSLLVDLGFSVG